VAEVAVAVRVSRQVSELIERISSEERVDKSTVIRKLLDLGLREWRVQRALDKYQRGEVTLLKASEMAGVTIYDMIAILEERKVPYRYDISDLTEYVRKKFG